MNERVVTVAIVAAASCALAVGGFAASESWEMFAPCRVVYRTHQAVQDSLACQAYAAISLFSLLLLLAAAGLALVAIFLALWRRRTAEAGR